MLTGDAIRPDCLLVLVAPVETLPKCEDNPGRGGKAKGDCWPSSARRGWGVPKAAAAAA